ncbi:MAG: nucleotidyltransferase family protein [Desulfobulbus sp.]|nr:MAG: nucleotidyltransferase family protein [Desulfobulbus sp.]
MQAMLLAAGFGTRLRPYTLIRPKPLFPVLNVPLLHILLDKLILAGCGKIVVNCHHLAYQIKAAVADRPEVILQYEPEILGTGGSLRKALPLFDNGPVLVMNGDIYHDLNVMDLLAHHQSHDFPVTMAMHDYPRFNSVHVREEKVIAFADNHLKPGGGILAFTGIHILQRHIIERIPEQGFFHIIDLYKQLAGEGQIGSMRIDDCFWQDIGTPEDYLDLHRALLCKGKSNDECRYWHISTKACIEENVELKEWGAVGPEAKISSGSSLARCVVWEGAHVDSGQELTDQIVCPEIQAVTK